MLKSIAAGLIIVLGSIASLCAPNPVIGSLLFCVGLASIMMFDLELFTGQVCGATLQKIPFLCKVLCGNIIGCSFGFLFAGKANWLEAAQTVMANKTANFPEAWPAILLGAMGCNALICIAVQGYKKDKNMLLTFLCVPAFVLSGFDHCIANFAYMFIAADFSAQTLAFIALVIAGNIIGGKAMGKIFDKIKKL